MLLAALLHAAAHGQALATVTVRVQDDADFSGSDEAWAVEAWRRTVARHARATARSLRNGRPPPPPPRMSTAYPDSGFALPGASVRASGVVERSCATDDEGTCVLPDLPAGDYTVTASMPTCGEAEIEVPIVPGSALTLPIALHCVSVCLGP